MGNLTKNKNFLFDLTSSQPNGSGEYHGGGKYAKKVFFAFTKAIDSLEWEFICLYDSSRKLDKAIKEELDKYSIGLIDIKGQKINDIIHSNRIDRIYSALPSKILTESKLPCDFYSTIHGLRFIEMGVEFDSLKYQKNPVKKLKDFVKIVLHKSVTKKYHEYYLSLLKNSHVIAVSNHTKFSIKSFFPDLKNDIQVFYSPDVTEFNDIEVSSEYNYDIYGDYFLLVSGNRWLKNNLRSILALDELFSERPDLTHNVIVTGVEDSSIFLKRIKNKGRFTFLGYVDENKLKSLYENAYAFLYMSLNEGFGYPPLEAMSAGVPVITSPFTSIVEICADSVLYSNPYSIAEIKNRILYLVTENDLYESLKVKGFQQFNKIRQRQQDDLQAMTKFLLRF